MEGEQKPLYAHPLPVMCPFPISLTSHSPLVALHIPGHSLAAGAELLGQLFLPPQVQPEERQQRSALSKAPSPGHGPGHTQLTGQDLGGPAHTPLHSVCGTPTQQTGALPGTCSGLKVSLIFLSNKQQPPFGFNPSALI